MIIILCFCNSSPGEVSDEWFLRFCCVSQLQLCVWLIFVSGMHMVGESQSNKTSPPIPPLQVEECALWQALLKVSHLKDPQNNTDPRPLGLLLNNVES